MTRYNQVIVKQGAIPTAQRDIYRDRFHAAGPVPVDKAYGADLPWKYNWGVTPQFTTSGFIPQVINPIPLTSMMVNDHFAPGLTGINMIGNSPPFLVMGDSLDDDDIGTNNGAVQVLDVLGAARMETSIRKSNMYVQANLTVPGVSGFLWDSVFNPPPPDYIIQQVASAGLANASFTDLYVRCSSGNTNVTVEYPQGGGGSYDYAAATESAIRCRFFEFGLVGALQPWAWILFSMDILKIVPGIGGVSIFNVDPTFSPNPSIGTASRGYTVDDGPVMSDADFFTAYGNFGFYAENNSLGPPQIRLQVFGNVITASYTFFTASHAFSRVWWIDAGPSASLYPSNRRVGIGYNIGFLSFSNAIPPFGSRYFHTTEVSTIIQQNFGLEKFEAGVLNTPRGPANVVPGNTVAQQLRNKEQVKHVSQIINAAAGRFFG